MSDSSGCHNVGDVSDTQCVKSRDTADHPKIYRTGP